MGIQHILVAAAVGVAPVQHPAEAPAHTAIPYGARVQCQVPSGCFMANEQGLQQLLDEAYQEGEAAGKGQCGKPS